MAKLLREEKGSVIILVAIGLVVFLGLTALVVDGGMVYVTRSNLQNAADAAALAEVQEITKALINRTTDSIDLAQAEIMVDKYGVLNGLKEENIHAEEILLSTNGKKIGIKVSATKNLGFLFGGVLGKSTGVVTAQAIAKTGVITGGTPVVPLSITYDPDREPNTPAILETDTGQKGWYGLLRFPGYSGTSDLKALMWTGYEAPILLEELIPAEPGYTSVIKEIDKIYDKCVWDIHEDHPCTSLDYQKDCPRLVIVPAVTYISGEGANTTVQVKSFALCLLDHSIDGKGKDPIHGTFIRGTVDGDFDSNLVGTSKDYGLYGYKLVK